MAAYCQTMSEQVRLAAGQGSSRSGLKSSWDSRLFRRQRKSAGEAFPEPATNPSSFTLGAVDKKAKPEHLVVLVNGIAGSAQDWEYMAEQFKKKLGDQGLVVKHFPGSACNSSWKTLHGVDTMGNRLAQEVVNEVENNRGVTKISFVGHSLGGLISRYAIGLLYAPAGELNLLENRSTTADSEAEGSGGDRNPMTQKKATIAGLEPINFITLSTPHLGCRDHQQLPFLFGVVPLEKVAPFFSRCLGNTGRHILLADDKEDEPLLKRMARDCDDVKFISALRSFQKRTVYANVSCDLMVGWRTASIREKGEKPEPLNEGMDSKYPHIVRDEEVSEPFPAPTDTKVGMIAGLQQVSWRRIDVNFSNARPYLSAHDLIQVRLYPSHKAGIDVVDHIIDKNF